jgi:hypothetical protein
MGFILPVLICLLYVNKLSRLTNIVKCQLILLVSHKKFTVSGSFH